MPGISAAGSVLPLFVGALAAGANNGQAFLLNAERDTIQLGVVVSVTAAGGTSPSATVEIQWSTDGVNFYSADGTADTFSAPFTAVGGKAKLISSKGLYTRALVTLSGTSPTMTMNVSAFVA